MHGRQTVEGRLEQVLSEFEVSHLAGIETVEATRVVEHRGVAQRPHIGQDFRDGALDGFVGAVVEMQQRVERGEELGLAGGKATDHAIAPAKLSITG